MAYILNQILKRFLVTLMLLMSLLSFSQKGKIKSFQLSWDMEKEIQFSNGGRFICPVVVSNFIDNNGVPSFSSNWPVSKSVNKVSHTIENIVYEKVDKKYLNAVAVEKIPSAIESRLDISKARNDQSLSLSLTPMIRLGGVVKKVVSFDLVYTLSTVASKSYRTSAVQSSVLSSGSWYKFAIDKTGVFKIDYNFLKDLGISLDGLNPKNIKIYGNGGSMLPQKNEDSRIDDLQENSIFVSGEEDGVFNQNDYILFYGQGPDYWKTDSEDEIYHVKNIYSDESYYFLNVDSGSGMRLSESANVTGVATDFITNFKDYIFKEDDVINIVGAGRDWFGDSYLVNREQNYNFDFAPIGTNGFKVVVKAVSTSTSITPPSMSVLVNEESSVINFSTFPSSDKYNKPDEKVINILASAVSSSKINVKLIYNASNPSENAYLDYIEIIGDKELEAIGNQFGFRNFLSKQSSKVLEYTIRNKSNIGSVWDVTDPYNPKLVQDESPDSSNFVFKANSGNLAQYHVLNSSDYYTPIIINGGGSIPNQDLHGLQDVQYVIVTRSNLTSQAERLANYHRNNSGLSVRVIPLNQIYNEFASGSPDITAIRDFVKHLYDTASSDDKRIKYVCLFGDGSYDYKDRLAGNNNIVPAYQSVESRNLVSSFVTDDYYGMMNDKEGYLDDSPNIQKQDVATGRILVSNQSQAQIAVDKILKYYNSDSFGSWHNTLMLVTDNPDIKTITDDNGNTTTTITYFTPSIDAIAEVIARDAPQYNVKKIYSDAYEVQQTAGGLRYPDVNKAISSGMEKGALLFNYFGHGGEGGFAEERIVTVNDIKSWVNFDRSPLFITITCDFTRFDNPARFTAGEEMIVSRIGGSASMISTSREVYISFGKSFNTRLMNGLLVGNQSGKTISEVLMDTKNFQLGRTQRFFISYFGDPAMKLATPKPKIVVTHINGKEVTAERDVLQALSKVKIKGEVQNNSGGRLESITGELTTIIFDKPVQRQTDNGVIFDVQEEIFDVQESIIFKGKTKVENGFFEYEFIVPKDIDLTLGTGKISFYFNNQEITKGGYDIETKIGGVNTNVPEDDEGPVLELFMDDKSFADGGSVSATPKLIAEFSDDSGINTSLNSIGHTISAVIDGDDRNPIVLNDFYEPVLGDYKKGGVTYSFRGLDPGPHTLRLKVWDTYNNSSEATLNFTVTSSSDMLLENVLNYPNPFVSYTEFWFTHNQPNSLLDVAISIYTISGKLIKSLKRQVTANGSLERSISWDGKDDFGDPLAKGVYVYKLQVTNIETGVTAEKYEKLVLLR